MTGGGRRGRDRLVVTQLALATALAVVGGLVMRTAMAMSDVPTGMQTAHLLTFRLALETHATDVDRRRQAMHSVEERLSATLGTQVGALSLVPALAGEPETPVGVAGFTPSQGRELAARVVALDTSALDVIGVRVEAGRGLTVNEVTGDADVALISRAAANRYFGGAGASLEREVTVHWPTRARAYRIVGVTGDVRDLSPEDGMPPRIWVPMSDPRSVTFVLQSTGDLAAAAASIRRVVREQLPGVAVESLATFDDAWRRRTASDRVMIGLLLAFALLGIGFASIGLYGTVAFSAGLRRAEFATRRALGAQATDIVRMVVGESLRLAVKGAVPGLALGIAAGYGMRSLLYGVTPLDPWNVAALAALTATLALVASLGPAVRATR